MNRDSDSRAACKPGRIPNRVAEDFRQGIAVGSQCLDRAVAVIDRVAVAAVGAQLQRAVSSDEVLSKRPVDDAERYRRDR